MYISGVFGIKRDGGQVNLAGPFVSRSAGSKEANGVPARFKELSQDKGNREKFASIGYLKDQRISGHNYPDPEQAQKLEDDNREAAAKIQLERANKAISRAKAIEEAAKKERDEAQSLLKPKKKEAKKEAN